jgi:hypothetical protein
VGEEKQAPNGRITLSYADGVIARAIPDGDEAAGRYLQFGKLVALF